VSFQQLLSTYKNARCHNPQVYSLHYAVALRVLFYSLKHLYVKSLPDITAGEMRNETAVYHTSMFSISSLSNVWFPSISKRKFLQASYSNFNHPSSTHKPFVVATFPRDPANSPELPPTHNCS